MRRALLTLPLIALLVLSATCATVPLPEPPDPKTLPSTSLRDSVDWKKAGDLALADLSAYLKVDTVNPPGNEHDGVVFLQEKLRDIGFVDDDMHVIDHGDNRGSLIARLKATVPSKQGALCLVNHIDVVTSEPERWHPERGPLSGAIVDEDGGTYVYGRGALDMKGMGIMELHALKVLIDSKRPRDRDIVFLALADEEVSSLGVNTVVSDEHWGKIGCTHAINEGGLGLKDAIIEGQTVIAISVGERGILWSRIVAVGPPGHGSTPIPGRAPEKLLGAMKRLDEWKDEPEIHPALYELLAEVGREVGGATGFIMQRPALVDMFVKDRLQQAPTTRAITNDTVHLTGFHGAHSPNVVPSQVWAQYDVRLLPKTTPEAMKQELEAWLEGHDVRLEVVEQKGGNESDWHDPVFRALQRHSIDGDARTVAGPIISPGFTDSIVLRKRGVKAYGVIPVVVTAVESAAMHGDNERVSHANLTRAVRVLALTLADITGTTP